MIDPRLISVAAQVRAIARMTETELADTLATIHQSYNPEVHA